MDAGHSHARLATIKQLNYFTTSFSVQLLWQLRMHRCQAPVREHTLWLIYEYKVQNFSTTNCLEASGRSIGRVHQYSLLSHRDSSSVSSHRQPE